MFLQYCIYGTYSFKVFQHSFKIIHTVQQDFCRGGKTSQIVVLFESGGNKLLQLERSRRDLFLFW